MSVTLHTTSLKAHTGTRFAPAHNIYCLVFRMIRYFLLFSPHHKFILYSLFPSTRIIVTHNSSKSCCFVCSCSDSHRVLIHCYSWHIVCIYIIFYSFDRRSFIPRTQNKRLLWLGIKDSIPAHPNEYKPLDRYTAHTIYTPSGTPSRKESFAWSRRMYVLLPTALHCLDTAASYILPYRTASYLLHSCSLHLTPHTLPPTATHIAPPYTIILLIVQRNHTNTTLY